MGLRADRRYPSYWTASWPVTAATQRRSQHPPLFLWMVWVFYHRETRGNKYLEPVVKGKPVSVKVFKLGCIYTPVFQRQTPARGTPRHTFCLVYIIRGGRSTRVTLESDSHTETQRLGLSLPLCCGEVWNALGKQARGCYIRLVWPNLNCCVSLIDMCALTRVSIQWS